MTKRTQEDLDKLKKLTQQKKKLVDQIWLIKNECLCDDYKVKIIETLKWEFDPRAVCPVCNKTVERKLTNDEIRKGFLEDGGYLFEENPESLERAVEAGGYNL